MQEQFVKYEQAVALKELGFDYPCFGYYILKDCQLYYDTIIDRKDNVFRNNTSLNYYGDLKEKVAAPLKSQVFDWFRKQGYDTKVQKESEGLYFGFYWNGAAWVIVGNGSYEEAESACIDKLIDIIKNK